MSLESTSPSVPERFDPEAAASRLRGASRRLRRLAARLVFGRRARHLVEAATHDLATVDLAECARHRVAGPIAQRAHPLRLRTLNLAVLDHIWRSGAPNVCLLRSTALLGEVRRHGVDAVLVLGVARPPGGPLAAHAWLEAGGGTFLEPPGVTDRFHVLARFPRGPEVRETS